LEPEKGPVGTRLVIYGSGFGRNRASAQVTVGGTPHKLLELRDDKAVVQISPECRGGRVEISVKNEGRDSSVTAFQLTNR